MAEEFQAAAGICGDAWWNSPKSVMFPGGCLFPCSVGIGGADDHARENGIFGLQNVDNTPDMKSRLSCMDNIISHNGTSMAFAQKLQREADSDSNGSSVTMDSTLQMMGLGFPTSASSSSSDWNHTILQEDLNPSSSMGSSQDCHRAGYLSVGFPISPSVDSSSSYGYSSSSLLTNFYEPETSPINNFISLPIDVNDHILKSSSSQSQLLTIDPKQQITNCGFHNFSNTNTIPTFWSSSSMANTKVSIRTTDSFLPSPQLSSLCHNNNPKTSSRSEVRDSRLTGGKKATDEPATKKPRITTTPSSLPAFKYKQVRKENLRDQITALQQLVSPFGKTDTASVLQEALEYIKFLHNQVSVLSTPYMKQGASVQQQQQQISDKSKDPEGNDNQGLRKRGLCLVPISSTFPVANETTADFWTPTFGGYNFR